jgi:hypothetical protein
MDAVAPRVALFNFCCGSRTADWKLSRGQAHPQDLLWALVLLWVKLWLKPRVQ